MASKLPYIVVPTPADGVRSDLPWQLLPPTTLVDAENVVLRDGFIVLRPGLLHHTNLADTLAVPPVVPAVFGVASYLQADSTEREVIWYKQTDDFAGNITGRLTFGNTFATAVTAAGTALEQGPISWRIFPKGTPMENWLVWCNGRGAEAAPIQSWDSESDAATFNDVAFAPKANAIMILANSLLAFGLPEADGGGSMMWVSDFNDFVFSSPPRQAVNIVDTQGEFVAALEMGLLRGAAYKTDSIYVISSGSSTDAPFTTELAATGVDGPINRAAIVAGHDGIHYWISRSLDLWQFDGVNARIVTPAFKALFLNLIGSSPEVDGSAEYRNTGTDTIWLTFDRPNQELVVRVGTATVSGDHPDTPYTIGLRVKLDGKYSMWPQRWKGDVQAAVSQCGGLTGGVQPPAIFVGTIDDNSEINVGYEGHWSGAGGQADRSDGTDSTGDALVHAPGYVHRTHDKFVETDGLGSFTEEFYDIVGYIKYAGLKPPTDDPYRVWMLQETDWDFVGLGNTSVSDLYGASAYTETETLWAQSHGSELLDPTLSTGLRTSGYMFAVKLQWETNLVATPSGGAPVWECSSLGPFFLGGRIHVAPRGFRR